MNLDPMYIFIFIRQDLFNWQQLVHTNHVALEMGAEILRATPLCELTTSAFRLNGHPNIVVVGVADIAALQAAHVDLMKREVPHKMWADPDDLGLNPNWTSLATYPITKQERNKLHHYRPWSERNNANAKGAG